MVVIDGVEVDLQNLEDVNNTLVCGHQNCGMPMSVTISTLYNWRLTILKTFGIGLSVCW